MSVNPADYNSDAINGEQLAALMQDEMYDRLKGDVPESLAVFLCSLKAQVDSIQKAMAEQNLGERTADFLDSQTLKVGGTDVKMKQAAKSNPSASSGSANTFVDTITQNENGEMTATRRVMKMYSGTGTNTDAPMTQKAVKDALDTKAPIASPTFTGTPAAPTASGSTDTTQIATTAFVHDAIENDLKKAADVSGMGNDDTHAYSGEAVSMAISSAVSGNVGGFLGNMTVAQMNSYTNPKMGDNAIVTDTGTITVGSEQCVILTAPSEVRWTTSGSWKISSAGYVRDTQYATTSVPGVVRLNTSNGGVEFNSNNQMVVHGWSTKQDSLPYANSKYGIDISGSSGSASVSGELEKVSLGQVDELPVSLIVSSNFKAGTFLLKGDDYGGQPYVFGNVTIPNNQWYRFTVSGQTSTDCVITLEPCTGGSSSPFNIFKILVDNGSSRTDKVMKVVRVPYESTTSAVGDSSTPIYVDESGEIKECNPSSMTVGSATNATTHIADSVVHVTAANKVLWNKAAQRAVGDTRYIAGPISSGIPIEFGAQGDNPSVKFAIGCDSGNSEIHITLRVTNGANNWMQGGGCEYCATTSSVVQTTTTNNTRGSNVEFRTQENYIIGTCPIPTSSSLTTKGMYKAKLMFYDSTGTNRINILDIELCYSRTNSVFSGYGTASVINALDN